MRAMLGPASRAAMQFGTTWTRRFGGTSPLTAPDTGVGRFSGRIGRTADAAVRTAVTITSATTVMSADIRTRRIETFKHRAPRDPWLAREWVRTGFGVIRRPFRWPCVAKK